MIVVTTPTGQIGRQVLTRLLPTPAPLRVIARDPSRLSPEVRDRVEVVVGSQDDAVVLDKAFAGAAAVFWLRPPDNALTSMDAFVDFTRPAAARFGPNGVRRVVGISALGRGVPGAAGLVSGSLATDDLIGASGVAYRALTMPSFMDNLLRQVGPIRDQGVFRDILEPGHRSPLVANRDIAAVAADLLLDETWQGVAERPVLGPEDLSQQEMAQIMSEVIGRPVRYQQTPIEELKQQAMTYGASETAAQARYEMMLAKSRGLDQHVTRTAATASPTTFRQWCQEVLLPAVSG